MTFRDVRHDTVWRTVDHILAICGAQSKVMVIRSPSCLMGVDGATVVKDEAPGCQWIVSVRGVLYPAMPVTWVYTALTLTLCLEKKWATTAFMFLRPSRESARAVVSSL